MGTPAILQMLGQSQTSPAAQIKQMIGAIRSAGNPQALMQQMLRQRNPQLAQAMEYVKAHGGDAKVAFEQLAAEKGIDPAEIEALLK